ncbi:hypothetical protein [Pseudonocardia sp. MH-G8]|uniref:hypothetical protein n=1 Tax=Pseudonocardia sp. MH-G8 TaxID=1854588 RepID=UPI001303F92F|nr:hypothetical protein [Pseudonocardia sp. MH-G8]
MPTRNAPTEIVDANPQDTSIVNDQGATPIDDMAPRAGGVPGQASQTTAVKPGPAA